MGIELNRIQGKRGGGGRGAKANPSPSLFQVSPQFFSLWIFLPPPLYLNAYNRLGEGASRMQEKTLLIESWKDAGRNTGYDILQQTRVRLARSLDEMAEMSLAREINEVL